MTKNKEGGQKEFFIPKIRRVKNEDLKREATNILWKSGWTEMEISVCLSVSITNVIRFKAEKENKK